MLSYHSNAKDKLNNLDYFTVSDHPEYKSTRCFFIVNKDGTRTVLYYKLYILLGLFYKEMYRRIKK